ncbi:MAG: RluA family pseudouridine synthase [Lentisphaeria bacterium]|nr:RluA family pseudouridine synthase [Lentisphaeria bacterium]
MKNKTLEFTAEAADNGSRLDAFLSRNIPDSSRAFLQKVIKEGNVAINGAPVTLPRTAIKPGATITVFMPDAPVLELAPEDFEFEILHEDAEILVINKPAGVVVHPGAGNSDGTVVNALLGRYPAMSELFPGESRPGIVHRLDKDTSGCLVIAKTPGAMFKLGEAFSRHTAKKCYLAVCRGVPQERKGNLTTLIGRHPVNRQKMAIVEKNGKEAITSYEIITARNVDDIPLAAAKVKIETGRTHQIRVHMSSINLPVVGDQLYGRHTDFPGVNRQQLHAWKLTLPHPASGEIMEFTAPVPEDMKNLLARLNVKVK